MKPSDQTFMEEKVAAWIDDWCLFAEEAIGVTLDEEQQAILRSVQHNRMTSVASGTARGKDFIAAVAAVCFLYLIPEYVNGEPESTKVAMTAPTDRQVQNIMVPEISKVYQKLKANGICPYGARLVGYDIRTSNKDYFLTGFKADERNHEAWSGFHAVNTFFIVTEASGISENVFTAIEGNLQGNSRLLLVFNNNNGIGYAAESAFSSRFHHFRLNSLNAPNVREKRNVIPGQVDYAWVRDKVETWTLPIAKHEYLEGEGDFHFEGGWYRPNDIFRVKVLGLAPKVSADVLVPLDWIHAANERWLQFQTSGLKPNRELLSLAVDPAGMGDDRTTYCYRWGNYVERIEAQNSGGVADHMAIAGKVKAVLERNGGIKTGRITNQFAMALIDTIGEGAGVYSRLKEQGLQHVHSAKFSEAALYDNKPLKDINGVIEFTNMRAYCYWAIRDWLNPLNKTGAMLPPDVELAKELSSTIWAFQSDGRIKLEKKEDIKKHLGRSPDKADALALSFFRVRTPQENERHRNILMQL